jgi:hypothetical protein
MALKVDKWPEDIPKLNRELQRIDTINEQFKKLQGQFDLLNSRQLTLEKSQALIGTNNILITWHGPTSEFTWLAAYTKDNRGVLHPMTAGARVVPPSNNYWFAWNPSNRIMSVEASIDTLTKISNLIVLCRVWAGTVGQTGVAGGGGSDTGLTGHNTKEYVQFPGGGGGGGGGPLSQIDTFTGDGFTQGFTTSVSPTGVFQLFWNGLLQSSPADYTRVGTAITTTFTAAVGDPVIAVYN